MNGAKGAIGIDVGGTFIKAGCVDAQGELVEELAGIPTNAAEGPEHVIGAIAAAIRQLSVDPSIPVGIGVPGIVSTDRSTVQYPPNLPGWSVVPLGARIAAATGARVVVENDANCAALGEAKFGSGVNIPTFIFATLGTGVGGGIIVNGELFRGEQGGAGEIGHTTIDYRGPQCNCGSFGCVETYVGNKYFVARVTQRLKDHPESMLCARAAKNELTPAIISDAAEAGDVFAYEELREAGYCLGVGLANAMGLLDIHTVILGGGIAQAGKPIFEGARRAIVQFSQPPIAESFSLLPAALGNNAGIIGAAALAL